ncbi:hypothetical protein P9Z86_09670, partial [Bacillus thuringiensis]|nr:hypothetical protein [Bacillus thuringiensis]
ADSNRIISSNEKNSTSKDTHIENESTTENAVLQDEYDALDTANLFGNSRYYSMIKKSPYFRDSFLSWS